MGPRTRPNGAVKGFAVEKGTPGFTATKERENFFRDTARVLRMTRGGVAWNAVGCVIGAYEVPLAYAKERRQFGQPIAKCQLIHDHLVTMLGNITAPLGMAVRVAQMQDAEP